MSEMGDSGGSGEAVATDGATETSAAIEVTGGAEDSGRQEASAESTAEASAGSAAEASVGEPGESEPADAGPDEGPDATEGQPEDGDVGGEVDTDETVGGTPNSAADAASAESAENGPVQSNGAEASAGVEASQGAEDSGRQEASAESTAEASGGSAAEYGSRTWCCELGGRPGLADVILLRENETGGDTLTEAESVDEISDESDARDNDAEPGENGPVGTGADEIVAGTAAKPQDGRPGNEANGANEAAARVGTVEIGGPTGADTQSPLGQVAELDQPERPDISMRYPSDYKESDVPPPTVDSPHQPPETWARDINPGRNEVGGNYNCGECARAVQDTWSGDASVAAIMTPGRRGEPPSRMNVWAGSSPQQATMNQVSDRLKELGPGSSAIVLSRWNNGGGGHYFNSINDSGTIKAIDGQSGRVQPWPPSRVDFGFDESAMSSSAAFYFDSNGKAVR